MNGEKQRLALIDLDTLIYIVAYNQHKNGNRDNPEQVKTNIRDFISTILLNTRADLVSMVYQAKGHNNFRKYFYPDYKANRPEAPEFIVMWKDTIVEEFEELGAIGTKIIESDDVLNIGYHRFKDSYELIIVSSDKDLDQIPGEHYNPRSNRSYYLTILDTTYNLVVQQLMGDNTDSVKGVPKIGIKTAQKIAGNSLNYELDLYETYQKAFNETWYSEYLKTKFLVTMLSEIDYDSYPFNQEVTDLFNIKPVSNLVISNLFN